MAASRQDIRRWLQRGKEEGHSYMLVVCDTFDHEDYPMYAGDAEQAGRFVSYYDGNNMQRVVEVYNLEIPADVQLWKTRVWDI